MYIYVVTYNKIIHTNTNTNTNTNINTNVLTHSIAFRTTKDASRYLITFFEDNNELFQCWDEEDMRCEAPTLDIFSEENLQDCMNDMIWGPISKQLGFAPFELCIYSVPLVSYTT